MPQAVMNATRPSCSLSLPRGEGQVRIQPRSCSIACALRRASAPARARCAERAVRRAVGDGARTESRLGEQIWALEPVHQLRQRAVDQRPRRASRNLSRARMAPTPAQPTDAYSTSRAATSPARAGSMRTGLSPPAMRRAVRRHLITVTCFPRQTLRSCPSLWSP